MTFYSFEIVVEKEADGAGYLAYSPTLPGCVSKGTTKQPPSIWQRRTPTI
jgi:predicted RNase H-like HicB family nuclease